MKIKSRILFFLIPMMLFTGCEKLVDYYIGIPQQPELSEEVDTDQLNIFGVLRPDMSDGYNKSFVFVQRIWPALEFTTFSILPDASVRIMAIYGDGSSLDYAFPLMAPDGSFKDTLYRPDTEFQPMPGQHYRISCTHPDLEPALGELVFPPAPELVEHSLSSGEGRISLSLLTDSLIEMYDFYLRTSMGSFLLGRKLAGEGGSLQVELQTDQQTAGARLRIYAYENKLAGYIGNSNTSLNFNKYREGFSSLDSGYGVFGALNFLDVEL